MKKTIAVIARTPALADAIKAHMASRHPNTQFVTVSKISDAPAGSELAGRGLPQFVPGSTGVTIHNVGMAYDKDATKAARDAQFATVNNVASSTEEILPCLGYVEEMFVLPSKAYTEAKALLTECRLNIAEAETPSETLKAYRDGFNALRAILTPAPAAPAAVADEAPLNKDEAPL